MAIRTLIIFAILLPACTTAQRRAVCPETVGVSIGCGQSLAGSQGTTIAVAVVPVWRIKPAPVAKVADSTGTLGTTPPTPRP